MVAMIDVRDAVIGALGETFPGMAIYAEEIKQGLAEPCFFVKDFPVSHSHVMGKRYSRAHGFDVHYFPASQSEPNEEAMAVADQLTEALEYIVMGAGTIRATSMRSELVDGVLHFTFQVSVHLIKQVEPSPLMESATIEETIK